MKISTLAISLNCCSTRIKVPGHNNAYYTQVPPDQQLFEIYELDVYPTPPIIHSELLIFMDGFIRNKIPEEDLANATLKFSGLCPHYYQEEGIFSKMRSLSIEPGEYGTGRPVLGWLRNMLSFHYGMYYCVPGRGCAEGTWDCSLEATLRLPNRTVLFSVASNFTMQYPPPDEWEGKHGVLAERLALEKNTSDVSEGFGESRHPPSSLFF
ncbi:hypothetical protein P154DRAFT_196185 [Amniculicola lignicola CBS 123094]|uniref:Uncharacterized protein n=1 Tax=Amniculicola lignicola CBS 123094 TaxID=1392246 RepID=A0A6A5WHI9_9PLEO|nr:hypothetical protein P154DRAFT_196185 [Amniculicola lignicola CBS 123094]